MWRYVWHIHLKQELLKVNNFLLSLFIHSFVYCLFRFWIVNVFFSNLNASTILHLSLPVQRQIKFSLNRNIGLPSKFDSKSGPKWVVYWTWTTRENIEKENFARAPNEEKLCDVTKEPTSHLWCTRADSGMFVTGNEFRCPTKPFQ